MSLPPTAAAFAAVPDTEGSSASDLNRLELQKRAIAPGVETPESVRDRVLEAARISPADQLGTTDDCGFAPFVDDSSTVSVGGTGQRRTTARTLSLGARSMRML
jgi:hypothetical protein